MKLKGTITPAEEVLAVAPDGSREVLGIILRHSGALWPECRQKGCSWKDPYGPRHEREVARAAVVRHYAVDHLDGENARGAGTSAPTPPDSALGS